MTDPIRNLLISLSSHMAYMQGQLEARHELDDPEDYYWYRESVLLRQKVTDALADEPAVPDGREPASVTGQPSDEDLLGIACQSIEPYDKIRPGEYEAENNCAIEAYGSELVTFARAVLARWGNPAPQPPIYGKVAELAGKLVEAANGTAAMSWDQHVQHILRAADLLRRLSPPQPPADGEVAELVAEIRHFLAGYRKIRGLDPEYVYSIHRGDAMEAHIRVSRLSRAADLLQRLSPPQPVPVSERLPGPEDCDAEGRCWWWYPEVPGKTYGYWAHEDDAVPERAFNEQPLHWLPAHALPLPGQEVEG